MMILKCLALIPLVAGLTSCTRNSLFQAEPVPFSASDLILLPLRPVDNGYGKCGINASISVVNYYREYKKIVKNDTFKYIRNLKNKRFASTIELFVFFKRCGIPVDMGRFSKQDLLEDLNKGNPVIVFLPPYNIKDKYNIDTSYVHCWVVVGTSMIKDLFVILTPDEGPVAIKINDFMEHWNKGGNTAFRFKRNS